MRALRFSSQLGFKLDDETAAAAIANKQLLDNISAERVFAELQKLLMGITCCSSFWNTARLLRRLFRNFAPALIARRLIPGIFIMYMSISLIPLPRLRKIRSQAHYAAARYRQAAG
jgi:hypothetical protein